MDTVRIGLIGDHNPAVLAHQAIPRVLELAGARLGVRIEPTWLGTGSLGDHAWPVLGACSGLWCVPASPYASLEGALSAIRFARENGVGFLGTCAGFQHALLEYARNVLGLADAMHAEVPTRPGPEIIAPLSCALVEKSGTIRFEEGSSLRAIYGVPEVVEQYHCSFGLNPRYQARFDDGAMRVSALDDAGDVRAVELTSHPFFMATLYQPERSGLSGVSHPLIEAFVAAAARHAPAN